MIFEHRAENVPDFYFSILVTLAKTDMTCWNQISQIAWFGLNAT